MIIKHKSKKSVGEIPLNFLLEVFEQTNTLIDSYCDFITTVNLREELEVISSEDEEELVEALDLLIFEDDAQLKAYCTISASQSSSINYYMHEAMSTKDLIVERAKKHFDLGLYLTKEDIEFFVNEISSVISALVHFIRFEFKTFSTALSINSVTEISEAEENEIVFKYRKEINLDLQEYILKMESLHSIYKQALEVFDEFPELEDEFEKIMGADIVYLETTELTIDDVRRVINGDIIPSDLLSEYYSRVVAKDEDNLDAYLSELDEF